MLVLPRSKDSCYILDVSKVGELMKFNKAINETSILWHIRLGHVNFKDLKKLSNLEVVRGLPCLSIPDSYVCGLCQSGKQTMVAHNKLSKIGTSSHLKLCIWLCRLVGRNTFW